MPSSFASEVKAEIAHLDVPNQCCRVAELAALLRMGAVVTLGANKAMGLVFTTENAAVARRVLRLLKEIGDIRTTITVRRSRRLMKHNSYSVEVQRSPKVPEMLQSLGIWKEGSLNIGTDSAILRKTCCCASYLRGAFLGGGSVNRPDAQYHLELDSVSYSFADLMYKLLRHMGLPAGITERKSGYVVYLKEGDSILDFLEMGGADRAAEEFEIARNLKGVRNQVNRLVNCETANLQKSVDAAGRQLEAINRIKESGCYDGLSEILRETAEARLLNPEAPLSELGQILHVGKSGINHRMRKLLKIAEEI